MKVGIRSGKHWQSIWKSLSFAPTDGSATVVITFGVICAFVGFEYGRPLISTTVPTWDDSVFCLKDLGTFSKCP